jgi:hypothetical protein
MQRAIHVAMMFAAAVMLGLPVSSRASTVTYTLVINDNGSGATTPGSYAVYADVSQGDNAGLASYAVSLFNVSTLTNFSPKTLYDLDGTGTTTKEAGFTLFRTNSVTGGTGSAQGNQNIISAIDSPGSVVLIYGYGQVADNFANHAPAGWTQDTPIIQPSWNAHLLLIKGTYNTAGPAPTFGSGDNLASVFTANGSTANAPADNVVLNTTTLVPDPSTGAGILLIAMLGWRRRRPALRR